MIQATAGKENPTMIEPRCVASEPHTGCPRHWIAQCGRSGCEPTHHPTAEAASEWAQTHLQRGHAKRDTVAVRRPYDRHEARRVALVEMSAR